MRKIHAIAVVSLAAWIGAITLAQSRQSSPPVTVPRLINVSGVFQPADGQPAARVEAITLSIYAAQEGGEPLWQETQSVAIDEAGRYNVLLGATAADGIPPEVFATGEAQWLGIVFARGGEVEGPRVRLTSVPYALRSADADTLGGRPASAYVLAPTDTTREGGAPDTADATTPSAGTSAVLPGTTNFLAKYLNGADVGNSAVYEVNGAVGIGTTAPLDSLHVRFNNTNGALTGFAVQNTGTGPNAYSGMLFYDQNGALGQFQGFNNQTHEYRINNIASGGSINFMIGSTSRFLVRNDGDIDISGSVRKGGTLFAHNRGFLTAAFGAGALGSVMPGQESVAVGFEALAASTGGGDVAVGRSALASLTNGQQNTAVGLNSLRSATGSFNVAVGGFTANQKVTGDFNAYFGYGVLVNDGGANTESNTIRIGSVFHNRFFATGVRGVTTGVNDAVTVLIDSNGQLGTVNSSRRYKEDIQDMGDASSGLMQLRPVTYRYIQPYADGSKPIDYGLIAEEVKAVYPDLVTRLANGDVETVQYHKINAMLLNEVQKQHRALQEQRREIDALHARLAALERALDGRR